MIFSVPRCSTVSQSTVHEIQNKRLGVLASQINASKNASSTLSSSPCRGHISGNPPETVTSELFNDSRMRQIREVEGLRSIVTLNSLFIHLKEKNEEGYKNRTRALTLTTTLIRDIKKKIATAARTVSEKSGLKKLEDIPRKEINIEPTEWCIKKTKHTNFATKNESTGEYLV